MLVKFKSPNEVARASKSLANLFDFDPFFGDWSVNHFNSKNGFTPKVDVTEDNDNLYVHAEIPGVNKEDVKVNINGDVLTVSGEKKTETKDENKNYYRIERTSGSFSRSFTLPSEIVVDKISAEYKDGVLNITLPKTEQAKVVEKQIDIK